MIGKRFDPRRRCAARFCEHQGSEAQAPALEAKELAPAPRCRIQDAWVNKGQSDQLSPPGGPCEGTWTRLRPAPFKTPLEWRPLVSRDRAS